MADQSPDWDSLRKIQLYFTVTTGRSGTAFLTKYVASFDEIFSVHEAAPPFHPFMRDAINDKHVAEKFWLTEKIPAIIASGSTKYCETSHLICKGFLEPLFERGIYPNLILLKRNKREVAKSIFFLNTIPGKTAAGLEYYLKPDDPGVLLPVENWQTLTDYQLCYWYTLEIEARQTHYGALVARQGAKSLVVDFEKLLAGKLFNELTDFFSLGRIDFFLKMKLRFQSLFKVNAKTKGKLRKSLTHDVDFAAEEQVLLSRMGKPVTP